MTISIKLVPMGCFRFQSYLVYLFLFFQADKFIGLNLSLQDEVGNPLLLSNGHLLLEDNHKM